MSKISVISKLAAQYLQVGRLSVTLCGLMLLGGCTSQYTGSVYQTSMSTLRLADTHLVARNGEWVLPFDAKIALAKPESPSTLPRSRAALDRALREQTPNEFPNTKYFHDVVSLDDALMQAQALGCTFVLYPRVLDLNNQRNQWSEILEGKEASAHEKIGLDSAEAELLIVDVVSGRVLDQIKINSRSSMFKREDKQALDLFDDAVSAALAVLRSRPSAS